jgi:hypothetical protein
MQILEAQIKYYKITHLTTREATPLIRLFPPTAASLIRPDLRSTGIVKYNKITHLTRGKIWPENRGGLW